MKGINRYRIDKIRSAKFQRKLRNLKIFGPPIMGNDSIAWQGLDPHKLNGYNEFKLPTGPFDLPEYRIQN